MKPDLLVHLLVDQPKGGSTSDFLQWCVCVCERERERERERDGFVCICRSFSFQSLIATKRKRSVYLERCHYNNHFSKVLNVGAISIQSITDSKRKRMVRR